MKWTKERPTKPGYYWAKHDYSAPEHFGWADDGGDIDICYYDPSLEYPVNPIGTDNEESTEGYLMWSDVPIEEPEFTY